MISRKTALAIAIFLASQVAYAEQGVEGDLSVPFHSVTKVSTSQVEAVDPQPFKLAKQKHIWVEPGAVLYHFDLPEASLPISLGEYSGPCACTPVLMTIRAKMTAGAAIPKIAPNAASRACKPSEGRKVVF